MTTGTNWMVRVEAAKVRLAKARKEGRNIDATRAEAKLAKLLRLKDDESRQGGQK